MTQTIDRAAPSAAVIRPDPTDRIIADFRSTMSQLKCASSERLLRLGVSMAQLHIMYTLQRGGEMTMSHLADVLNVSLSNATGLIDRLEERGFIERNRVPEDRRVVLVRVTPDGEGMLREIDAMSDEILRSVLDKLPGSQLRAVAHAMSAFRDAVAATVDSIPDRHPASTPNPRPGPTISGTDLTTQHGRD